MKSWLGWALRRARASVVLVATLFALVAVTSGILAFTLGNSGILATTAARDALLTASPGEGGVTAQTRMAPDVEAQDALAREKLTEGFAPAPVDIWTTYVSEPRRATDGPSQALILWAGEHLAGDPVRVTAGAWPSGPGEAALHVGAAEKAGIEPGARFTVDGHELTVTALWEPDSPFDPLWFGEDLVLTGTTGAHLGPLVVDRSVLTGGAPFIRWGVVPDVETIAPSELNSLAEGAAKARELVKAADVTGRGIRADGDLAATAEVAARDYTVGQSFGFVPVSLLILVAVVGLVQVAGLLAATREREVSLLLARGASRRQLIVAGLGEATVAAVAGAAVGTAVAAAMVWLLAGNAAHLGTVLWGGLVSLALSIVCLGAVTVATTVRLARGDQPRSDRVRGVAGAAALVLVVAAAVLATWQLLRAGTFVTTTDDGDIQADLLPALSPALLMAAAAVVGLVALAPVTRLLELASRRIRSTGLWLAGAQLARGLVVQAVPVVLTILAVGTATLASFYSGSYAEAQRQLASLSQGAPVRAILGNPPAGQPFALPPVAEVDGVGSAVPVWLQDAASVGNLQVPVLAAPLDQLADTLGLGENHPARIPADDGDNGRSVEIPSGTTELQVTVEGSFTLDPWQELQLAQWPAFNRALANDLGWDQADGQYQFAMESLVDEYSRPYNVRTQFLIRDASTGLSRTLSGPTLDIPSPTVGWAGGDEPITFEPSSAKVSGAIDVPEGPLYLDGVRIFSDRDLWGNDRTVNIALSLDADGQQLLGEPTAEWGSDTVVLQQRYGPYDDAIAAAGTPTVKANVEVGDEASTGWMETNRPPLPASVLDTSGSAWTLRGAVTNLNTTVGPTVRFVGDDDPLQVMSELAEPRSIPVPVGLTSSLAKAVDVAVGDTLEVATMGVRVPSTVAAIVDDIPGLVSGHGLLLDSRTLFRAASPALKDSLFPSEMWGSLDGNPDDVRSALLRLGGIDEVAIAEPPAVKMAASSLAFWVAAASALVLAITGLAAATATQVTARRPEVAVLRALGMTPRQQATSRAWEIGGILALATVAGFAGGWVVARLVVEPVVRAASGDTLTSVPLAADAVPLMILLAIGAIAVIAIIAAVARAVRRQALDNEYREEVR